jgi:hypothetical protein
VVNNTCYKNQLHLQLGDLIAISNLIDDESVRGTFLSSMEEGQADADAAKRKGEGTSARITAR